jgi:D-alanine-D-alanine ligase
LQVSLAGEIVVEGDGFYDYENKYLGLGAELKVPTELSNKDLEKMHELAIKAFRAAGCSGLARTDFFLTKKGLVLTEINTLPGFTPISMYPALFAASDVSYPKLIETLIARGLELGNEPR